MADLALILYTALVSTLLFYIYRNLRVRQKSYRTLVNVRGPPPETFWIGNIAQLISEDGYNFHENLSHNYRGVVKLHAICGAQSLYVFDPTAMHSILIADQPSYEFPESFLAGNQLIFGPCLLSTKGEIHRKGRKLLNKMFSQSQLREMLPILYHVSHESIIRLGGFLTDEVTEVDMRMQLENASLESVGQALFDYSFIDTGSNTLKGMKKIMFIAKSMSVLMLLLPSLRKIASPTALRLLMNIVPFPKLHTARDLVYELERSSKAIFQAKREAIAKGENDTIGIIPGKGKDLLGVLLQANNATTEDERLSQEEILGQISLLIFAGTDSTSVAMARCLEQLATHPGVQEALREEISKATDNGNLNFEELCSLPLLDAVYKETLRLYPPALMITRQCVKDTILPLNEPVLGVDDSIITEIAVPAGTFVYIAIKAANTNKAIWGLNSLDWEPSRWFDLPQTVLNAQIPAGYSKLMTFIGGPRTCIGFKFAEMSFKASLLGLIKNFEFSPADKTITWKNGVVEAPTVNGEYSLPMMVRRIE